MSSKTFSFDWIEIDVNFPDDTRRNDVYTVCVVYSFKWYIASQEKEKKKKKIHFFYYLIQNWICFVSFNIEHTLHTHSSSFIFIQSSLYVHFINFFLSFFFSSHQPHFIQLNICLNLKLFEVPLKLEHPKWKKWKKYEMGKPVGKQLLKAMNFISLYFFCHEHDSTTIDLKWNTKMSSNGANSYNSSQTLNGRRHALFV